MDTLPQLLIALALAAVFSLLFAVWVDLRRLIAAVKDLESNRPLGMRQPGERRPQELPSTEATPILGGSANQRYLRPRTPAGR